MKKIQEKHKKAKTGFTLVELMIAISVSIVIAAAVYSAYKMQQKSFTAQDLVTETQQNIRAGMFFLNQDIRMAGYDPTFSGNFDITTATAGRIVFTVDDNGNAVDDASDENGTVDAGETITFELDDDANNDGIADNGSCDLVKNDQPIAEDIERIQFLYILDDGTQTLSPADPDDIRSITISILARSRLSDPNYTDTRTFTLGNGTVVNAQNDNFRRRLLISTVKCRNMGL